MAIGPWEKLWPPVGMRAPPTQAPGETWYAVDISICYDSWKQIIFYLAVNVIQFEIQKYFRIDLLNALVFKWLAMAVLSGITS